VECLCYGDGGHWVIEVGVELGWAGLDCSDDGGAGEGEGMGTGAEGGGVGRMRIRSVLLAWRLSKLILKDHDGVPKCGR
jgi:hypothetical protein